MVGILVMALLYALLHNGMVPFPELSFRVGQRPELNVATSWLKQSWMDVKWKYPLADFVVAGLTLTLVSWCLWLVRGSVKQSPAKGTSYCANKMTVEEFEDMSYTRKAVVELINSPEYRKLMAQKGRRSHGQESTSTGLQGTKLA